MIASVTSTAVGAACPLIYLIAVTGLLICLNRSHRKDRNQ